jgi:hypothetical protein
MCAGGRLQMINVASGASQPRTRIRQLPHCRPTGMIVLPLDPSPAQVIPAQVIIVDRRVGRNRGLPHPDG